MRDLRAVHVRQSQIQNDEIRRPQGCPADGFAAGLRFLDMGKLADDACKSRGGPQRPCARRSAKGRLPQVLTIAALLAAALGYLHGEGIVHRDVSPQNVLLSARLPLCITHAPGHMLIADVAEDAETTILSPN